ncbi:MAG: ABC transporter permease [Myxococcales bacterium]|nr:ABC transporter permease [Myxococcales bacterium]MCB9578569.1 ABC transporter permease [Polyangiaceae bacterium]
MARYLLERVLGLLFVLFGISVVVFLLMAVVPGNSAHALLGPYATEERVAALSRSMGLDRPVPLQYLSWLSGVLSGDLGRSYALNRPVVDVVFERLGPTLLLGGAALLFGTVLGLFMGAVSARNHARPTDTTLRVVSLVGISTPAFWLGMSLMLAFAVWLHWFPVSGIGTPKTPLRVAHHLALPAITLGAVCAGVIARMTRTAMLEVTDADFVRVARAKGLSQSDAIYRHAFLVALSRVIPVIGLQAGYVLGGAVYVETVFQWPGLGLLLVNAIEKRDLFLAQGAVLVMAAAYVLVNLSTDLLQRALDPRVRA